MNTFQITIYYFFNILEIALFARCICSWFYQVPLFAQLYQITATFTEPIVAPVRKLLSGIQALNNMPLDMSVLVTFILMDIVKQAIIYM